MNSKNKRLNPCELQLDLYCKGIRIDPSCTLEKDSRSFSRTRAGLGSGLELIIPGDLKEIWTNVPVEEAFAQVSPYLLFKENDSYFVMDESRSVRYPVNVPPQPKWYTEKTSSGRLMMDIGVLQGTYLGIYLGPPCGYWKASWMACKFCTSGENVGINEALEKSVDDVVETCRRAKEESGVTFIHFNTGFQGGDRDLQLMAPYVKAVKERVGLLVGVQAVPAKSLWLYDWLIDLGTDHFSFCFEFYNQEWFAKICPGKDKTLGLSGYFRALEYTSKKLGKGAVSGEIIAGVEPIQDTLNAIDFITDLGAFPTVCVFRPLIGAEMEEYPPPNFEDMVVVFRHMYEACRKKGIPIGIAPNIEVSLICQPTDAEYLVPYKKPTYRWYHLKNNIIRLVAKPHFRRMLTPHPVPAREMDYYREHWRDEPSAAQGAKQLT